MFGVMARKAKVAKIDGQTPDLEQVSSTPLYRREGTRRGPDGRKVVYSVEEVRRQLDFIEGLMTLGASTSAILAQASKPVGLAGGHGGLGITAYRANRVIQRIQARWEEEDRERSKSRRTEASRRILRQIQNCQGRRDPHNPTVWIEKPNHVAIVRYEELLSKLQGTQAPIEIDLNVQHSETLVATFARYSVEHLQALHAKAQAKKRLAAAYLEEHPEAREAIEAEGVTVG